MFNSSFFLACLLTVIASTPISFAYAEKITIVAMGDSVTAGYGVAKEKAWPALLEKKLKREHENIKVINAGISGATTASAVSNLKWQLKRKFQILILCLGGNDGLRGLDLKQSEKNLAKAISMAKSSGAKVLLVGMKLPKNYGEDYRKQFSNIYPRLAKEHKVSFMPFLLKDVGGIKDLNLPDGIHPNEKGYQKVVENIFPYVEKLL